MATADINFYGVWLSDDYLDLRDIDIAERVLLSVIGVYAKMKAGVCWLSNANLAEVLRCTEREIQNRLGALIEAGYLTREIVPTPGNDGGRTRHLRLTDKCPETVKEREQRQKAERSRTPVHHHVRDVVHHPVHHPVPANANEKSGTPLSVDIKKKAEQAESPRESADGCNPPQQTCLPAASIAKPLDDDVLEHLVCFCLAHGAIADDARAIRAELPRLTLPFVAAWTAEFTRRCKQDGKRYDNPAGWLRTGLRSGEMPRTPETAPPVEAAPARNDGSLTEEEYREFSARYERRQAEEREARKREVQECLARIAAHGVRNGGIRPGGGGCEAVGATTPA